MSYDFGVGFAAKASASGFQLLAQVAEILDNPVMHDCHPLSAVRMRVDLCRATMRCPTRVADAYGAVKRLALKPPLEVFQFPLGAAAGKLTVLQSCHSGRIVTAIFQAPQGIDEVIRDRLPAENPDDSAHPLFSYYSKKFDTEEPRL